jgi:hypothetical protein
MDLQKLNKALEQGAIFPAKRMYLKDIEKFLTERRGNASTKPSRARRSWPAC